MMHALYQRGKSASDKRMTVPTLYVRSLASYGGPEYSLRVIFQKARETAPCYLVFEDLDSIVNDSVRSYFLNEVDGLKSNDGILMVGSTNHLDRLDPGISKRPSRFDRKYYFADPDFEQRVAYAKFWQGKLKSNEDLEFPDELCPAIAKITDKFSFAYMQEAFVASLLAIAVRGDKEDNVQVSQYSGPEDPMTAATRRAHFHRRLHKSEDSDPGLDKLVLWKEIQVQVKILKEEMDEKSGEKSALQDDLSASFCPRCNMSSTQHDAEEPPHAANERENKIKGASIVEKAAAAKPSLFTSFEQWKAAKSSRLPNSTVRSNPVSMPEWVQTSEERMVRGKSPVPSDDELKHMLESPIGMTPEFRTRMVLEDVERVRGEMLRYQISRSEVGTSMQPEQTAASPQQEAGLQTWPVARGGLPLTSNTADPTPSEQALREWSRLNNPRHEPVSASFTRESSEIPPSAEWLLCEQRLRMLDERKEFERKMEDIRAKIAMIE
jgi:SpoVK/Ycf46/Vps4 family AAA+-type ATPase